MAQPRITTLIVEIVGTVRRAGRRNLLNEIDGELVSNQTLREE